MDPLEASVYQLLDFHPQTITNVFNTDVLVQELTAAVAAPRPSLPTDGPPPPPAAASAGEGAAAAPAAAAGPAPLPPALLMAERAEGFVTELTKVLGHQLKRVNTLWGVLETLASVTARMEAQSARGESVYVHHSVLRAYNLTNSTDRAAARGRPGGAGRANLREENQKLIHRCLFAAQLVKVVNAMFDAPAAKGNTHLKARALLRLALNQNCLLVLLELLAVWCADLILPYYHHEPPAAADGRRRAYCRNLLFQYNSSAWGQLAATLAAVGGTPLSAIEYEQPRVATVLTFRLQTVVPTLDEDLRDIRRGDVGALLARLRHGGAAHRFAPYLAAATVPARRGAALLPCFYHQLVEYVAGARAAAPSALGCLLLRAVRAIAEVPALAGQAVVVEALPVRLKSERRRLEQQQQQAVVKGAVAQQAAPAAVVTGKVVAASPVAAPRGSVPGQLVPRRVRRRKRREADVGTPTRRRHPRDAAAAGGGDPLSLSPAPRRPSAAGAAAEAAAAVPTETLFMELEVLLRRYSESVASRSRSRPLPHRQQHSSSSDRAPFFFVAFLFSICVLSYSFLSLRRQGDGASYVVQLIAGRKNNWEGKRKKADVSTTVRSVVNVLVPLL
ncbi:hypothetical protein STCU_11940 [Strigomonas culicis]|uniref:Uncharacterized protein n=1 Tax=Strigomonas culicis TaxID=28005 RepID=S9TGT1_9TRYP|nr:hypothetical protein STCU_11940 [Strigomonas culicis]|eukprot:EPY15543.1 hypothetical protein STCU_11940 [Strigomonas culicis]